MSKLVIDITDEDVTSGYVKYNQLNFKEGLKELTNNEFRLISLEETLELRVKHTNSFIFKRGNWVKEAILKNGKRAYLLSDSPILQDIDRANNCYKKGLEFYLDKEEINKLIINSIPIVDEINLGGSLFKQIFKNVGHKAKYTRYWLNNYIRSLILYSGPSDDEPYVRQLVFLGTGAKCQLMALPFSNYDIIRGIKPSLPKPEIPCEQSSATLDELSHQNATPSEVTQKHSQFLNYKI